MEKLLSGVALALISGLTFVAYKHPDGYARILKPIRIIFPVILCAVSVWDISASRTFVRLISFIEPSKVEAARIAVHDGDFLDGYVLVGYVAVMAYLEFLARLHPILGDEKPPKNEGE